MLVLSGGDLVSSHLFSCEFLCFFFEYFCLFCFPLGEEDKLKEKRSYGIKKGTVFRGRGLAVVDSEGHDRARASLCRCWTARRGEDVSTWSKNNSKNRYNKKLSFGHI